MDPARSSETRSARTSCTSTSSGHAVSILGGGPAGSIAAIAALREGATVSIVERSQFPRHKVCGEFLSPEILPVLDRLGLAAPFASLEPFRVRRMALVFGTKEKRSVLPEPAFGLSRYAYDHFLWSAATGSGATHAESTSHAHVIAAGRSAGTSSKGSRLFGFKAHFEGPINDAVELYFLRRAYVGINCVEGGATNVCGLAPENLLRQHGFEPESLFATNDALGERLRPLQRSMKWLFTGPLEYRQHWDQSDTYLCGDALSFVDPFTGSGLLCAALTGSLAGTHAARRLTVDAHVRSCRNSIRRPFLFSSMLRTMAGTEWAERLVGFVPAQWLYKLTRAHAS